MAMADKEGRVLVVGAGVGGIRAALDLAETGRRVTLIDRSPHLGGLLSQLDNQFPTNHCGMCKMLPLIGRDAGAQFCLRRGLFHDNIEILPGAELVKVEGEAGRFEVWLKQKPNLIDPERCIGCGECAAVCPVEVPDPFNAGQSRRKAVFLPLPHSLPNSYLIDEAACTRCGECVKACPTGAIRPLDSLAEGFRVLVVDDELIVRDSTRELIIDRGFAADSAGSGPEALEMLASTEYSLMLLDIKMPGMDGLEVLKRAREIRPDLPVVMMTAYATVETAVEAMKIGAHDYVIKPFEDDAPLPLIRRIYEERRAETGPRLQVGAIVLSGDTVPGDPTGGLNRLGYGRYPDVVTNLEFERLLSNSGPSQGRLARPSDGRPVRRAAWIQCVGSRDLRAEADFCSSFCCMAAIKQALLAGEKTGGDLEAAIFYMDLRTYGRDFQRYRDLAEQEGGVRFLRSLVHSVIPDPASGDLRLGYTGPDGKLVEERFDLVVLSVGRRPSAEAAGLAQLLGLEYGVAGLASGGPFSPLQTGREGIILTASGFGLAEIGETVIRAGSAALTASLVARQAEVVPENEPEDPTDRRDVSAETARVLVAVCSCGRTLTDAVDRDLLAAGLQADPDVDRVVFIEEACTVAGRDELLRIIKDARPNRVLVGACQPCLYSRQLKNLALKAGLDPGLTETVDVRSAMIGPQNPGQTFSLISGGLKMGLARVKRAEPGPPEMAEGLPVVRRALVVGGGIAGLTAALSLADHGIPVDLVEKSDRLGGNLTWLRRTLEGDDPQQFLAGLAERAEGHPLIELRTGCVIEAAQGEAGRFITAVRDRDGRAEVLEHGATILACGGGEAATSSYGHGTTDGVVTQMELEQRLADGTINPKDLKNVVMIQCVESREEPRNYCSRVCCPSALKNALFLKEQNPGVSVYVLYRDMMTPGLTEAWYTRARRAGVMFISYRPEAKPEVLPADHGASVKVFDPVVRRDLLIDADLVVLATGVVPEDWNDLAAWYGASMDRDGFFEPAEPKWRPVDALNEGVFACGLMLSPRAAGGSLDSARAAASRALRLLQSERIAAARVSARVRHSLCSLCERCLDACPYQARSVDPETQRIRINPALCQGCGSCAAVCPNSASVLRGFPDQQFFAVIDAALEGALA